MKLRNTLENLARIGDPTAALVLAHGRRFRKSRLPSDVEVGEPKMCFMNACHLAIGDPDRFTYVEGYISLSSIPGFPIHHAWCATEDGRVVDPTITDGRVTEYFGVPLDHEYVVRTALRTKVYGVISYTNRSAAKDVPNNLREIAA